MRWFKNFRDPLVATVYFFVWAFYDYIFQFHKITSCLSKLIFDLSLLYHNILILVNFLTNFSLFYILTAHFIRFFYKICKVRNSCHTLHMKYEYHLVAVVGFQVKLFDFAHQRVSRVCSCTLVIECLFYHFIQCSEEVFFFDAPFFDRFRNSDCFL